MQSAGPGRVINIGVGRSHTLNEAIILLNAIFGRQVSPRYDPPHVGDVLHSRADISLARHLLGYEPKVFFEDGMRETVDWYRSVLRSQSPIRDDNSFCIDENTRSGWRTFVSFREPQVLPAGH